MEHGLTPNTSNDNRNVCLELRHIKKDYYVDKRPFTAIHDLSVCFPVKGFVAILGHSGSGKTTLLNIIGGLDHYTEGDMLIDGISTKDYRDRDWDNYRNKRIGFVFQSYNLIPHLTVLQNVVMSLQLGGLSRKVREEKARSVLARVGLEDYLNKRPNQLSGGQMQRVAIARALVNDPDIILADEPTGALDSATSVQVMDLIREVGKDRCVILVTHNRELADQYADRIIQMKDGRIESDSDPLSPRSQEPDEEPKGKRSAMSFWTALGSSARNIRTKKGRTALTAIACSFGIIGVALVLATSNGFSQYVGNVEVSVASSVPITINPISYRITTLEEAVIPEEFPSSKTITVYDTQNSITTPEYNNLSAEYFEYIDRMMTDTTCKAYGAAMSILYNRSGLDFHFLSDTHTKDGIRKIDQYSSAGVLGSAISTVTSLPTTIIHELYGDEDKMSSLYDTIEGRFPVEADEMAIVVDRYNRIDFSTMRKLGFFPSDADYMKLTEADKTFTFDDILYKDAQHPGRIYKCYRNSDYFQLPEKAEEVPAALTGHTYNSWSNIEVSSTGSLKDGDISITVDGTESTSEVFALREPGVEEVYNDDAKFKPIQMKIVGVLRPTESSYIQLMPASLAYTSKLTKLITDDSAEGTPAHALGQIQKRNWYIPRESDVSKDGLATLQRTFNEMANLFNEMAKGDGSLDTTTASLFLSDLASCFRIHSVAALGDNGIGYFTKPSYFLNFCRNFGVEFKKYLKSSDVTNDLMNMMSGDIAEFFDPEMDTNIMDLVAYSNSYSLITSILIFPAGLTTKETLHNYLDEWNNAHPDNVISYSDIMSDFMGGLGTMIQVISAVLIVFASISLVVSSVMTAIITYVSVIERTKEIGVLRACGARKHDVSRLFEAECVIIGGIAGLIGVGFTIIACFPINAILDHAFPGNNLSSIAQLNPWHALLLIAISIALAFVSGFIPSRIAANKDPVICLRSE